MGLRRWGPIAGLVLGLATLSACVGNSQAPVTPPLTVPGPTRAPSPSPIPSPLPKPSPSAPVPGRSLYGLVALRAVDAPWLGTNAAPAASYALLAQATTGAVVTFTTLEETLVTFDGRVVTTTTDAAGRFSVDDALPRDLPVIAHVALRGGHRLTAIALPGMRDVTVDEASSMVVETLRGQIPTSGPAATRPLAGWTVATLADLSARSLNLFGPGALAVAPEPAPIPELQVSGGPMLRNRYVAAFGRQVTAAGQGTADVLSDIWRDLLGRRPLAFTRAMGDGERGDDGIASEARLAEPFDAVADAAGNVFVADRGAHRLRFTPQTEHPAWLAVPLGMSAGRVYTLAGAPGGPSTREAYEAMYEPLEARSLADPAAAPPVRDPATGALFPLLSPTRLVVETLGIGRAHFAFTSDTGNRVMWIPGQDVTRFGRRFKGDRLYTLAGTGEVATGEASTLGDAGPAAVARLSSPSGLAADSRGNLYVLDAGSAGSAMHGGIRLIRATDGRIFSLPLFEGDLPLRLPGAQDLRVVEEPAGNFLLVADTLRHVVWRVALPAELATFNRTVPARIAAEILLGQKDRAGLSLDGTAEPVEGLSQASILLSSPSGVGVDSEGRLLVADTGNGRLRMREATGTVHTLAGGASGFALDGDARAMALPGCVSVTRHPGGGLLVVDTKSHIVRRLWSQRSAL